MSRTVRIAVLCLAISLVVIVFGLLGLYGYRRYIYPYGPTHRCTRLMWFMLTDYASAHEGRFPRGELTPEASLSLLYREGVLDAATLAGRAKSVEVAKRILESGELLGPDTCDWHYVEGLTWDDNWQLAILWDKSSLGHTGHRLHGGHEIVRLYGVTEIVPADKWDAFLAEQAKLHAARSVFAKEGRPLLTAKIEMPDGTVIDHPGQSVDLSYESRAQNGSMTGSSSSGTHSYLSRLCWYYPHIENGTTDYRLSFSGLRSEPVTVKWRNAVPEKDTILFRMR